MRNDRINDCWKNVMLKRLSCRNPRGKVLPSFRLELCEAMKGIVYYDCV